MTPPSWQGAVELAPPKPLDLDYEKLAAEVGKAITPGIMQAMSGSGTPTVMNAGNGGLGGGTGGVLPTQNTSSPYAQSGVAPNAPLPREMEAFMAQFGPGYPYWPQGLDLPPPGAERPEPRRSQYEVAWNLLLLDREVPWTMLRGLATTCDVILRSIDIAIDTICGLDFDFTVTNAAIRAEQAADPSLSYAQASRLVQQKFMPEIDKCRAFWETPDRDMGQSFSDWLTAFLTDYFTYDAMAVYPQLNLDGSLRCLALLDASTIKCYRDDLGRRPQFPNPAYGQVLWGFIRGEFQHTAGESDDEFYDSLNELPPEYQRDQLAYYLRRWRNTSMYGYSPVEEAIPMAITYLARQQWLLSEYCYDDQTEVLTDKGWRPFKNLDRTERVASRGPGGEFVWEKPTDYVIKEWDDDLIEFKNSKVDLLVTPNHRMLLGHVEGGTAGHLADEFIMRADETAALPRRKRQKLGIPTTCVWKGKAVAEKIVPDLKANRRHPAHHAAMEWLMEFFGVQETVLAVDAEIAGAAIGHTRNSIFVAKKRLGITSELGPVAGPRKKGGQPRTWRRPAEWPIDVTVYREQPRRGFRMPMPVWAEFLGLYIAEGSHRVEVRNGAHRNEVSIHQSSHSGRLLEVLRIIDATPFHWMTQFQPDSGMLKFTTSLASLGHELKPLGRSWEKYVPDEIKNLPPNCLDAFLNGFWVGDGFLKQKGLPHEVRGYGTSSRRLADDLQELIQKCGRDATIIARDQSRWANNKSTRIAYQVIERRKNYQHLPKGQPVAYYGNVYCVSVPSGLLYVRRNGKPAWCGNTDGSTPMTWMKIGGAEGAAWTPQQFAAYEQVLNSKLSGLTGNRHRIRLIRGDFEPVQMQQIDEHYKVDYDAHLITHIGALFGVSPTQLGIQPRTGLGGGKQMQGEQQQAETISQKPLTEWLVDKVNDLNRRFLGISQVITATFGEGGTDEDELNNANRDKVYVSVGLKTLNDIRGDNGDPLYDIPEADQPMIITATGPAFISGTFAAAQAAANEPTPTGGAEDAGTAGGEGQAGDEAGDGGGDSAGQSGPASDATPTEPVRSGKAPKSKLGEPGQEDETDTSVSPSNTPGNASTGKAAELATFTRFVAKRAGKEWRPFVFQHQEDERVANLLNYLGEMGEVDEIKALVADGGGVDPKGLMLSSAST